MVEHLNKELEVLDQDYLMESTSTWKIYTFSA